MLRPRSHITTHTRLSGTRNTINEWLNILQSIQLPFALVPVLSFTASACLMGDRFAQTGPLLVLSVALVILVSKNRHPFQQHTRGRPFQVSALRCMQTRYDRESTDLDLLGV